MGVALHGRDPRLPRQWGCRSSASGIQVVIVLIGIGALALLLWEPHIEGVNAHAAFFEVYLDPFIALVYIGSIPFFMALYQAFKVLTL